MKKANSKAAEAVLEDLEVREVSVVDRPANQRRFLIVKSEDGLAVTMEDMSMKESSTSDMREVNASLLDVLDIGVSDQDPGDAGDVDAPDEEITVTKKQIVLQACASALERLTCVANELKQAESTEPVSDSCRDNLSGVLKALAGECNSLPELSNEVALSTCAESMRGFISVVEKVKELDDQVDEIPKEITDEISNVTKSLVALTEVSKEESVEDQMVDAEEVVEKEEYQVQDTEKEVPQVETEDPTIVIKAGAKISATRLSKLRDAFKALSEILSEVDSSASEKGDSVKKEEPAAKAIDFDTLLAPVKESLAGITETIEKLATRLDQSIEEVAKRVTDLEGVTPAASEEDAIVEVEKKQGGLFSGVLGPIVKGR